MPFITPLCCWKEFGENKWVLRNNLIYERAGVTITVPAEFETDFASVPRVPIAYLLVGNSAHEAAVVHDYLYRKNSIPCVEKKDADEIFLDAMKDMNVPGWQRYTMYWAVRLFGAGSYHKRNVEDKL